MKALSTLAHQVIPHSTLTSFLKDFTRPNDKINRMSHQGEIVALKKGFYALTDNRSPTKELIANHLSGPSYVSRQWALAYYGLMAEQVTEVTSMCITRSQKIENAVARFSYQAIPAHYYSLGLHSQQQENSAFMMANREKALCDLLISTRYLRLQSTSAVLNYLLDNLRLDEEDLLTLDIQAIASFIEADYKTALLTQLVSALETLHD